MYRNRRQRLLVEAEIDDRRCHLHDRINKGMVLRSAYNDTGDTGTAMRVIPTTPSSALAAEMALEQLACVFQHGSKRHVQSWTWPLVSFMWILTSENVSGL